MEDYTPLSGSMHRTEEFQDTWRSPGLKPGRSIQEPCDRSRKAEWDLREMRTATTKVRREVYETFRGLCEDRGETPYAVLRDFVLAYVDHFGGGGEAAEVDDSLSSSGRAQVPPSRLTASSNGCSIEQRSEPAPLR